MNVIRAPQKYLFYSGVFLLCMCGLMLQILETRLLSVIAWYYLAFFAISMAMFGMTMGALLIYFNTHRFRSDRLLEHLSWIASAIALAVVMSTLSTVSTVLGSSLASGLMVLLWFKLILIILPPYVLAGMAISLALTQSPWPVGLVYGVDLVGAAAGCLLALALMSWLDGVSALFAVGAVAAAAASCFRAAWRRSRGEAVRDSWVNRWFVLRHPALLSALLAALAGLNGWAEPHGIGPTIVKDHLEFGVPAAQEWNSFSRVRAEPAGLTRPEISGPSPKTPPIETSQMRMGIDGAAATTMYRFDGNFSPFWFLKYDVTNLAYTIRHHGRSAVIGVGGGRDMLSAHYFGFTDVTGVELNPIFVKWLTGKFRNYNQLADVSGTHLFVDEARSWFARTKERFDLIEMSLIDTWAATGAGAFSLSENGLYTVEGWQHFLDALAPNGVLTVSRWYNPKNIAETGRLLSLAAATLRSRNVAHPREQIYLASSPTLATIIVSNAPFSADDLTRLHAATSELGFTELASPDRDPVSPVLARVLNATTAAEFNDLISEYHVDLTAPSDDRPFFFNQLVLTDLMSVRSAGAATEGIIRGNLEAAKTISVIVVLSLALVLTTIVGPSLPTVRQAPASLALLGTLWFGLIGLGFMFIEIGVIQRVSLFLGHPVYGLAIGLFSMILSTGIGSLLSERIRLGTAPRIAGWAGLLCFFVAILSAWFPLLVGAFEGGTLAVRTVISLTAIVPSGILMGFGFPTGMRLVNAIDRRPTPWFWAINGAAGVLATSVAVGTSIAFSIHSSLWIGAGCYLLLAPVGLAMTRLGRAYSMNPADWNPERVGVGGRPPTRADA
jgi:SAM-dependent methyltransferase